MMKSFLIPIFILAATVCDQGAPGRQGPWGVYLLPAPTSLLSVSNNTYNITPAAVGATSCGDTVVTESIVVAGEKCAVSVPPGFVAQTSLLAQCITGAGQITFHICNSSGGSITPQAGVYGAAVF